MAARLTPLPTPALRICTLVLRYTHVHSQETAIFVIIFPFTTGIFFLHLKLACDALTNIMQRDL